MGERPLPIPSGHPTGVQLIVDSLSLIRGPRTVVERLSVRVAAGEALLLTGPNGAGKTTVLRALAGFLEPAAGDIRLEGGDPERTRGEQCHYVGHLDAVKPRMTVAENLTFWAAFLGEDSAAADVSGALARVELDTLGTIPAGYLSAGQKRRLALARLLVVRRPIWLLDEPTASLDEAGSALLVQAVNDHLAAGGLAVAATHQVLDVSPAKGLRLAAPGMAA